VKRARRGAAVLALAGVLCAASLAPSSTEAAWTDTEVARGSLTAGEVMSATGLGCSGGLLQQATFRWTAPTGGLTRTGYRWTITVGGVIMGSGTLGPTATQVSPTVRSVATLGQGTFSLYSVGPGGWESRIPTTGTVFIVSVLIVGVLASCS
jgi:predicted ribosomally synthesized peptide with SipW-like signal peptide